MDKGVGRQWCLMNHCLEESRGLLSKGSVTDMKNIPREYSLVYGVISNYPFMGLKNLICTLVTKISACVPISPLPTLLQISLIYTRSFIGALCSHVT